jgi:hypothetical protein
VDEQDAPRYARAPEPADVVRICRALNEAGALYLLVDDAPENVERVKRGLAVLADNAAAGVSAGDVREHVVVRVADEVVVDLMGRACGLSYSEAAVDAETLERDGVTIRVASPRTLIRLKDTPRPQDAMDRAFLEGVLRARGEVV